jgi:hypothetical protein
MSPSLTAGLPGGSRAGFTSGGVVLHVRGLKQYTNNLKQAGAATQLFGRQVQLKQLTTSQKRLLAFQKGLITASNTILKVGAIAAAAGVAIGVGIGAAALKTASDVQQLTYALQGLVAIELGKQAESQGLVLNMADAMKDAIPIAVDLRDRLRDLSLESPIQYEQVFQALRLQLAYGATATATAEFTAKVKEFGLAMDKAESPALSMAEAVSHVGAVLARDSATFERLNYNLAQAIQKGDLTAKNMRELRNAGLSLEDVFKSELNMTLEETRAALKANEISTADLSVAFISYADKYFAPAAERMTRSLQGLTNNFKDLYAFAATDAMTPVLEVISRELGIVFDKGEALLKQGAFKKLGDDIASFAEKMISAVKSIDAFDIALVKTIAQTALFAGGLVVAAGQVTRLINVFAKLQIQAKILFGTIQIHSVWAGRGIAGVGTALTGLYGTMQVATVGIGALLVLVTALVIAVNNWYDAQKKVAEELVFTTDTYGEYLESLEKEKASRWAITESLYDELKARKELDEFLNTDDLIEQGIALGDLVYKYDENWKAGQQMGEGLRNLFKISGDWETQMRNLYERLSDQQKILGGNTDEMAKILVMMGYNEEAAYALAANVSFLFRQWNEAEEAEKKTEALAAEMAKLDTIVNRSIPGYLAQQQAMERSTKASDNLVDSEIDQKTALKELEQVLDEINQMYETWNETLIDTLGAMQDIEQDMVDAHQDFADAIEDINNDLADDLEDIAEKYDDEMPDPTSEEERAGLIVDAWDEWARRMKAIRIVDPGEDADAEGGWLSTITAWTEGTDAAMRTNEENVAGWMLRLERMFYEGKLPDEFYEEAKNTSAWQEFYAELDALREEDERKKREAAEKDRIAEEQKLEAAKAAAEQERQDALLLGALTLAESTGQLQRWADSLPGVMGAGLQTAQQVFDAIKTGAISIPQGLENIIGPLMSGLIDVGDTAAGTAETNEAALDGLADKAAALAPNIKTLKDEYDTIKATLDAVGGDEAGAFGLFDATEIADMEARLSELDDQLSTFGLGIGGENFPGQAEEMKTTVEGLFAGITTGIEALDAENEQLAISLANAAEGVAAAWYNAYFGESVVPDTVEAVTQVGKAWDGLQTHMKASLIITTAAVKATWALAVKKLKEYLGDLSTKLGDVANELKTIKEMSPIKVTIEIKVVSSPGVGLAEGTQKVNDLGAALSNLPTDIGVAINVDFPIAAELGRNFGQAIIDVQSAQSTGGKKTHGRWWDFTKNLQVPAKRIAGLADSFAKIWTDVELVKWEERIAEIDKLIKEGNISEEQKNDLMHERLRLQDRMVENEETMLALDQARADLDFLNKQVELLEIIRNHGLNAREILGDITLGIETSASDLMTVTTKALQAVVEQINRQLQIASPSKVMMEVGKFMMEGMGEGIAAAAAVPVDAAQSQAIAPIVATGQMGPMNVTMNNTINTGIDQAVFENRVLDIIRRGARGY